MRHWMCYRWLRLRGWRSDRLWIQILYLGIRILKQPVDKQFPACFYNLPIPTGIRIIHRIPHAVIIPVQGQRLPNVPQVAVLRQKVYRHHAVVAGTVMLPLESSSNLRIALIRKSEDSQLFKVENTSNTVSLSS